MSSERGLERLREMLAFEKLQALEVCLNLLTRVMFRCFLCDNIELFLCVPVHGFIQTFEQKCYRKLLRISYRGHNTHD